MKILFMGTPQFAVASLEKLNNSNHTIVGVVCQPDRPVGRKMILSACPTKLFAQDHDLNVFQFENISKQGIDVLKSLQFDAIITCAFGQMLSDEILSICKYGVINVHASLLPKYRGASPIQTALLCGEKVTGITIMKTAQKMDSGDIILQKSIEILPNETSAQLFERLSGFGADLLLEALNEIENGTAKYLPQQEELATFCKKLDKADARLDFSKTSEELQNIVRAYDGAKCTLFDEEIKIHRLDIINEKGKANQILASNTKDGLVVATSNSAVRLSVLQLAGKNKMQDVDLLRGKLNWQK